MLISMTENNIMYTLCCVARKVFFAFVYFNLEKEEEKNELNIVVAVVVVFFIHKLK